MHFFISLARILLFEDTADLFAALAIASAADLAPADRAADLAHVVERATDFTATTPADDLTPGARASDLAPGRATNLAAATASAADLSSW